MSYTKKDIVINTTLNQLINQLQPKAEHTCKKCERRGRRKRLEADGVRRPVGDALLVSSGGGRRPVGEASSVSSTRD